MAKKYNTSIFIFTRDLRLEDNTTLIHLSQLSKYVIPIFIFNPIQINNNEYKSDNCVQFMCECLDQLNENIKKRGKSLEDVFFSLGLICYNSGEEE